MATHHVDIRWQLALARLRALPQPSWPTVLGAVAAAVLAMWWIMARQAPVIDPHSVIAANLSAGQHAVRQQRLIEPFDRSALHHFTAVLALDPSNAEARAGLNRIAEHFVEGAKSAIVEGRIADAAVALDALRRVQPEHRRIALLDAQLRRALEERAMLYSASAQTPKSRSAESRSGESASVARPAKNPELKLAPAPLAPQTQRHEGPMALASTIAPAAPLGALAASSAEPAELIAAPADEAGGPAATPQPTMQGSAPPLAQLVSEPVPPTATPEAPARARTLLTYVAPQYPRDAMLRGIEGWIDVQMSVTPAGDVVNPTVQAGKARQLFERNALAAVRRWKYDARPEAAASEQMNVRVSFKLQD